MAPVFATARASTNRAPTVKGAGLENPARAWEVSMTPANSSTTTPVNTSTEGEATSRTRQARMAITTAAVNQASAVIAKVCLRALEL